MGIILIILEAIARSGLPKLPDHAPAALEADAKNEARAIGNQITQHFHGILPGATPQAAQPAPQPSMEQEPPSRAGLPILELQLARGTVNSENDKLITFDSHGKKCLTVSVLNRAAPPGQHAYPARSVCASLEFIAIPGGRTSMVNRAVWVGDDANEINISVNDTAHILVGIPEETTWMTFHNPNRISAREKEYWAHIDFLEPRPMSWGQGAKYAISVTLISNADHNNSRTLAHRVVELTWECISFRAVMVPLPPSGS